MHVHSLHSLSESEQTCIAEHYQGSAGVILCSCLIAGSFMRDRALLQNKVIRVQEPALDNVPRETTGKVNEFEG